jgi:hypothetical protein
MKTFKSFIVEGRPSQQHALEGHDYHKKTDNELRYVMKDAGEAAKAMRGHNEKAENKYMDQVNDASTVLHFRKTHGMPDWYKKKYGHIKEEVEQIDELSVKKYSEVYKAASKKDGQKHIDAQRRAYMAVKRKAKETSERMYESSDKGLAAAHAKAKEISKREGVVQHIEKDPKTGQHTVSDWYDSDRTVATYNNGKLREDVDHIAEGSSASKYKVKSIGTDKNGDYYISPNTGKKVYKKVKVGSHETPSGEIKESAAWQRSEGKNPEGGLNRKGIESYRREHPGSKLSMAVTTKPSKLKKGSKAAKRRKSFCARMSGMKRRLTSAKTANDPNSRINKSLRKWNC